MLQGIRNAWDDLRSAVRAAVAAGRDDWESSKHHRHLAEEHYVDDDLRSDLNYGESPDEVSRTGDTGWMAHDGIWESKIVWGRSGEGHHFEVVTSRHGGEGHETGWSGPYPTEEEMRHAAWETHENVMEPHDHEALLREEREIAAFERSEARREADPGRTRGGGGLER